MPLPINKDGEDIIYTEADYYNLPEGERAELIDGKIYDMSSPSQLHQELVGELCRLIGNHIYDKKGKCKIIPAPFDVKLDEKKDNIVQPDISVICDKTKLDGKRCNGAPDLIIEIASPSNASRDYLKKFNLYKDAGVREYWIVNPDEKGVSVFKFGDDKATVVTYEYDEPVPVGIYDDLKIDFADIMKRIEEE